jgi:hypothetical protein
MHAAAPAEFHLGSEAFVVDLILSIDWSKAYGENACQSPGGCLRGDQLRKRHRGCS